MLRIVRSTSTSIMILRKTLARQQTNVSPDKFLMSAILSIAKRTSIVMSVMITSSAHVTIAIKDIIHRTAMTIAQS